MRAPCQKNRIFLNGITIFCGVRRSWTSVIPVKGLYVWFPYGFAVRTYVYRRLRELLDRDHNETLFPLLIPEQEFMKEAEHIKGFENEVYWVTHGGTTPLE